MFKFETLDIWKNAVKFARKIYKTTRKFPREELFGLIDQLKRAVVSISANIAEGSGSSSVKDYCHYLDIAIKSTYEVVSHLYIAEDNGYISNEERQELYKEAELLVKQIKSFKAWLSKNH
jgi:four helix bundle protein